MYQFKVHETPVVHRGQLGENVVEHFLDSLLREEEYIKDVLSDDEPLVMNKETEKLFPKASHCHICEKHFGEKTKTVRDHYYVGVEGDPPFPGIQQFPRRSLQLWQL